MTTRRLKWILSSEDRTKRGTDSAARNFDAVRTRALALGTALVGLAGAAGFGAVIKRAIDAGDEIQKLSIRLGASTEALSELRLVADRSGVAFNTMTMALQRQGRRLGEAAQGFGEARNALKTLNLDAAELIKLPVDEQLEVIADALSNVENEFVRNSLAMKIWDSEGLKMVQMTKDGAEGIRALRKEAQDLGLTLSQDQANAMAQAKDAIANMTAAFGYLGQQLATSFAPIISKVAQFLAENVKPAIDIATLALKRFEIAAAKWALFSATMDETERKILSLGMAEEWIAEKTNEAAQAQQRLLEVTQEYNALLDGMNAKPFVPWSDVEVPNMGAGRPPGGGYTMPGGGATGGAAANDPFANMGAVRADQLREQFELEEIEWIGHAERIYEIERENMARLGDLQAQGAIEREKFNRKTWNAQVKDVTSSLVAITQGVAQHNKTLFRINKVAGIANAIINTYEGVSKTLAKYPWPLAGVMAAAHLAAGLAQVSAIQSASYEGGGGGTTPSAAGSTPVVNDQPLEQIQPIADSGTRVQVIIEGNIIAQDSESFQDTILEIIEDAAERDRLTA